jgi:dUTP pyrophosphatase
MTVLVKFKALHTSFKLPEQKTFGSSGFDLCYCGEDNIHLPRVGFAAKVPLGFSIELPEGYEAQIRPRSGLAAKYGVSITNAPGTIDADFRGEVQALLVKVAGGVQTAEGSLSQLEGLVISPGDRVCQMVIQKVPEVVLTQVDELSETSRSGGGFGSTGGFGGK